LTEFRIGHGHDGPARVGEYLMGTEVHTTPALTAPASLGVSIIPYKGLGRMSRASSKPSLLALPFEGSLGEIETDEILESDSVLLPSMLAFSTLGDDASTLMLRHQLNVLERISSKIDPGRVILRVPEDISVESFVSTIPDYHSRGVRAAAFTFDGLLGNSDFNSLQLRSHLPMSWLAVALGRISPGTIPLIYYMGFDIIDIGHAQEAAANHQRLWHSGSETIQQGQEARYCPCARCQSLREATSSEIMDILLEHNMNTYASLLSESVHAMTSGRLRWLVESTTHYSPAHASLLRRIDRHAYAFIEEFTPSSGACVVPLIGPESYNAPVVRRFREYVADRYHPPSGKRIALLLPCSARKPYSDSKSHRRFLKTIVASLGGAISSLAQIVLTSPLGLVPHELERVFPAANYDIPVTGDWDAEETALAADALVTHLGKFDSDLVVIAHVSEGYLDIVKTAEDRISQTIIYTSPKSSPTGWESQEALQETLSEMKEILSIKGSRPRELEEIVQATADFQFGYGAGALLVPEHARLFGKPYRQIICRIDKEQVCSYLADAGFLSLTLDGAERLAPLGRYWVHLDAPSVKGGSIFAVGVQEADPVIRPGDEVIVLNHQNEVTAVGRSEMSGREMCELERGRAVSVRHKVEGV
jgi:archaeosine synthase